MPVFPFTMDDETNLLPVSETPDSASPSFFLVPANTAARTAVNHIRNRQLVQDGCPDRPRSLWVSFADTTEYSLGKGEDVDIYLPEAENEDGPSNIDDIHAVFSFFPAKQRAVTLVDRSTSSTTTTKKNRRTHYPTLQTTEIGESSRSVVVAEGINTRLEFGRACFYKFKIHWHRDGVSQDTDFAVPYTVGPTNSTGTTIRRYIQGIRIMKYKPGRVWKAVDLRTGTMIAVKKLKNHGKARVEYAKGVCGLFVGEGSIQHVSWPPKLHLYDCLPDIYQF